MLILKPKQSAISMDILADAMEINLFLLIPLVDLEILLFLEARQAEAPLAEVMAVPEVLGSIRLLIIPSI